MGAATCVENWYLASFAWEHPCAPCPKVQAVDKPGLKCVGSSLRTRGMSILFVWKLLAGASSDDQSGPGGNRLGRGGPCLSLGVARRCADHAAPSRDCRTQHTPHTLDPVEQPRTQKELDRIARASDFYGVNFRHVFRGITSLLFGVSRFELGSQN